VSAPVPVNATVDELTVELSAGDVMADVGAVLSNVIAEESLVEVTGVPAFPAMSEKLTVNATAPSVSPASIVCVADHAVGPPVTDAEAPAMVTVGVPTDSDEVNVTVATSPVFATAVFALLETICTDERVGMLESIVTDKLLEATETFPAASVSFAFIVA